MGRRNTDSVDPVLLTRAEQQQMWEDVISFNLSHILAALKFSPPTEEFAIGLCAIPIYFKNTEKTLSWKVN